MRANLYLFKVISTGLILGVSGCQTNKTTLANEKDNREPKILTYYGDVVLQPSIQSQPGTIIQPPSFTHVLYPKPKTEVKDIQSDFKTRSFDISETLATLSVSTNKNMVIKAIDPSEGNELKKDQKIDLSIYAMKRWDRFCASGIGMDEPDWNYIDNALQHIQPPITPCNKPKHNKVDYLNSWSSWCAYEPITDIEIVRDSVKPRSINCPRIKI